MNKKTINGILELVSQQIPKEYNVGEKLKLEFIIKLPLAFEESVTITSVSGFHDLKILNSNVGHIDLLKNKVYNINITLTPGETLKLEIHGEVDLSFEGDVTVEPLIEYKTSFGVGFTQFGPFKIQRTDRRGNLPTEEETSDVPLTYQKKQVFYVIGAGSKEFIKALEEETKKLIAKIKFIPITIDQYKNVTKKELHLGELFDLRKKQVDTNITTFIIMAIEKIPKNLKTITDILDKLLSFSNTYLFAITHKDNFQNVKLFFNSFENKDDIFLVTVNNELFDDGYKGLFKCLDFLISFYYKGIANIIVNVDLHRYASFRYDSYLSYYGSYIIEDKEKVTSVVNVLKSRIDKIMKVLIIIRANERTTLNNIHDCISRIADAIDDERNIPIEWSVSIMQNNEKERLELMVLEKVEE